MELSPEGCRDEKGILGGGNRPSKGREEGGWAALEAGSGTECVFWGRRVLPGDEALRGSWADTYKDQAKEYIGPGHWGANEGCRAENRVGSYLWCRGLTQQQGHLKAL